MVTSIKLAIFIGLVCCAFAANNVWKEEFSWKIIDFDYPDQRTREEALNSGKFIPKNNLPLGLERWKNKLFVTLPRWKEGTAATLTYIDLNSKLKNFTI